MYLAFRSGCTGVSRRSKATVSYAACCLSKLRWPTMEHVEDAAVVAAKGSTLNRPTAQNLRLVPGNTN